MNIFSSLVSKRIVATVSALSVIAVGCTAGLWQVARAQQKMILAESLATRQSLPPINLNEVAQNDVLQRHVFARGVYLPAETVWLDNRPRPITAEGSESVPQSGFYVMMPLKLDGSGKILWVNRGWAPRNNENRTTLPPVSTPQGSILVEGIALANPGKVFELGKSEGLASKPRIEQNFSLEKEAELHGWEQLPFILRQSGHDGVDGLARSWSPPTIGVERHYAYAFQWFALALSGFLFWLITGLRQHQRQKMSSQ